VPLSLAVVLWVVAVFALALTGVVKASSYFVEFATRLARRMGVSEFLIGLTLVAVGTSLPELTNSVVSSLKGINEFALGNIIGSNMANVTISVGLAILLGTITVESVLYRRELFVLFITTVCFLFITLDGVVQAYEGLLLLVFFAFYMLYANKIFSNLEKLIDRKELSYFVEHLTNVPEHVKTITHHYKRFIAFWSRENLLDIGGMVASGAVLLVSANYLVDSAVNLAAFFGVTSTAVGATIVAVGTTTPELSVSIASVRKGYHQLLFGNLIGSNIVNILLIFGLTAAIQPITITSASIYYGLSLLLVSTVLFLALLSFDGKIRKVFGFVFLGLYALFALALLLL
jgi:cation:H+ antiporter